MSDGSEFQVCGAATENASQRVHVAFLDQTAVVDELELKVLSATYESWIWLATCDASKSQKNCCIQSI